MYIYICICTPVYGRWENMRQLFLSFEGRIRTKDTRRPPHASPWWSRIISCRVADPWIGFWVSAYPEIRLLPSLLLHRILLSSITPIPCVYSTYLETHAHVDFRYSIFSFEKKKLWNLDFSKKKNFHFRSPRFREKEIFSIFLCFRGFLSRFLLTFSYFSFLSRSSLPFGMAPTRASSCCGWLLIWLSDLCISLIRWSYASSCPTCIQIEQAYLRPSPIHPLVHPQSTLRGFESAAISFFYFSEFSIRS